MSSRKQAGLGTRVTIPRQFVRKEREREQESHEPSDIKERPRHWLSLPKVGGRYGRLGHLSHSSRAPFCSFEDFFNVHTEYNHAMTVSELLRDWETYKQSSLHVPLSKQDEDPYADDFEQADCDVDLSSARSRQQQRPESPDLDPNQLDEHADGDGDAIASPDSMSWPHPDDSYESLSRTVPKNKG